MDTIEIKHFAPVLIPTLSRYEHLKSCLESLSKCTWANETEVFIAVDYPSKESHWAGYNKIIDYLETVDALGFNKVNVIKRKTNCGVGHAKSNLALLVDFIKSKYNMWIITEDDNVFSPNFLDYMNKALTLYEDDNNVIAVSGYNYPIDMGDYKESTFLSHYYTAWGIGKWKGKQLDYSIDGVKRLLDNKQRVCRILFQKPFYLYKLFEMLDAGKVWSDYYHMAYCMIKEKYNLLPSLSVVRNIGQDGTGLNSTSKYGDIFMNQMIDDKKFFNLTLIKNNVANISALNHMKKISIYRWLILVRKTIKYYINK